MVINLVLQLAIGNPASLKIIQPDRLFPLPQRSPQIHIILGNGI
jgi:hypothetical protein